MSAVTNRYIQNLSEGGAIYALAYYYSNYVQKTINAPQKLARNSPLRLKDGGLWAN